MKFGYKIFVNSVRFDDLNENQLELFTVYIFEIGFNFKANKEFIE